MDFRTLYKNKIREAGSKASLKRRAKAWYNGALNESSTRLEFAPRPFSPGSIYTYKYNPVHRDKLYYFDLNPMMFSLGKHPKHNLEFGVNLNFFTEEFKIRFLSTILEAYSSQLNESLEKSLPPSQNPVLYVKPEIIKELLPTHYRIALRTYHPYLIRDPKRLNTSAWVYIPVHKPNYLFENGVSVRKISENI